MLAGHRDLIVDLGTGDGRGAVAIARSRPESLVLGMDAVVPVMADVSRRAARPAAKGGVSNVVFVVAAAEGPPPELVGRADEVTISFPWGSLARGVLGLDAAVLAGIAAISRVGARIETLISVSERDRTRLGVGPECLADRGSIAAAWAKAGLEMLELGPAEEDQVRASRSTWARRLEAGRARPVTRIRGRRG